MTPQRKRVIALEPKKRKLAILAAIIESYVETGEPVGSKTLAEFLGGVSSATVRNDMAALAESGYLEQPHTSAGRIPSQRGYRMYVDRLMNMRTLPEDLMRYIDVELTGYSMDPDRFLAEASRMLSSVTRMAAIATTPAAYDARITGVELMRTGPHTCVLMIMISPAMLKSRICRIDEELTPELLDTLRQVLRMGLCGKRLSDIDLRFINSSRERLGTLGDTAEPLLIAARETVREGAAAQIMMDGQTQLLIHEDFSDKAMRDMLGFLSDKERLGRLLAGCQRSINVYIGSESGHPELSETSIITARYSSGGGAAGWVGVIGPTRMNYSRIIPYIEYFSTAVGKVMSALEMDEN